MAVDYLTLFSDATNRRSDAEAENALYFCPEIEANGRLANSSVPPPHLRNRG